MNVVTRLALVATLLAPGNAHAAGLGVIHGTVLDSATAAPIADALVTVTSPQEKQSVKTDQLGGFVLGGLELGSYAIVVSKKGYDTTSTEVNAGGDRVATIVTIMMPRTLRAIKSVMLRDWPALVNPYTTADVYVSPWSHTDVNLFKAPFYLLPFVPGLTFGSALRMMR
jgi:hypothetical protein